MRFFIRDLKAVFFFFFSVSVFGLRRTCLKFLKVRNLRKKRGTPLYRGTRASTTIRDSSCVQIDRQQARERELAKFDAEIDELV